MKTLTWLWWRQADVAVEREQASDEGRDVSAIADEFAALAGLDDGTRAFQDRFHAILDRVQELSAANAEDEPSDLAGIQAARPCGPRQLGLGDADLADRVHGAWLGRCAGCLLGKPIEGWRTAKLWGLLKDSGRGMLSDYLWRMDIAPEAFDRHEAASVLEFGRKIDGMPEDDDTNYTVLGLALLLRHGFDFTPDDVAACWMQNLPILHTCTAERVAYRNVVAGVWPPASAAFRNPYREWIGAQIRADAFGYVAVGRPMLAAELAWRDASISHVRNGIYGEMWVAAMLAAAAVESDIRRVIDIGLSEIPARCRLAGDVRRVLDWHAAGVPYLEAVARIHRRWNEANPHHWCHVNANAQIVALGLLYGEGDFEQTVTRAVYPCLDTDCNGATAGSVVGMLLGARALPSKWTAMLRDTLLTGVSGYHRTRLSELAAATLSLANPR